ncbi:RNA 2',3'-cyclic phosphodiesterase [Ectothiorhodospiraceae bacterium 2226]|nr:RNA 2',3'-cyclic phosphodiesterase [Ectothiorhodospiraceae bacterium 2226]
MPSNGTDVQRLFFALWPDEAVRAALWHAAQGAAASTGRGRPTARENLHLTLAFVGSVAPATAACLRAGAARIRGEPFDLRLDTYGQFPRAGVMWLGSAEPPAALLSLAEALGGVLQACELDPPRASFHPHVTLWRRIALRRRVRAVPPAPAAPIVWPVREFVLVASKTHPEGVRYEVLERWPLRSGAGAEG